MNWKESVFLLSRVKEALHQYLVDELNAKGMKRLVPSHGDIISTLRGGKQLTMTVLANKISRDRSTVTTLVEKLIKEGFVDSAVNPKDKRSSIVFLTQKGEGTKEDFSKISAAMLEKMFTGISPKEREQWADILKRIYRNLI